MGPLFSGGVLLLFGGIALVISLAVAKIFLPFRSAVIAALLFVIFSGFGTLIGLFTQSFWLPATLETAADIRAYFGISALCGLLLGAVAVSVFLRRRGSTRIRT